MLFLLMTLLVSEAPINLHVFDEDTEKTNNVTYKSICGLL